VHGGYAGIRDKDGGVAGGPTEHLAGFFVAHDTTDLDGYRCEGAVNVDPHLAKEPGGNWTAFGTLEGGDLTLSPSVLCRRDGFHGFVRDGKWVSA
jgi:hypothetical protein